MSAIAAWVASIAPTASLSMVKTSGLIPNGSLPPCGRCGCKAGTTSGCGRHCHVGECGRPGRMRGVTTATPSYEGHRYPVEIINHCVWLYWSRPWGGVKGVGRRFPRRPASLRKEPTSVSKRVSPTERLRAEIDEVFAGGEDLSRAIERVAQLGAQLLLQSAVEAEVAAFLGRDRYERAASCGDPHPGMRNGYCPTTVKTTAGPVTLARPKLRGTTERFASQLFGTHVTKTNALESLVIAGFVRGLSTRDVEAALVEALGEQAAVSKSTGSRICGEIKTQLQAWSARRLDDVELDYLFLDGSHFKYHANASAEPVLAGWGIDTGGKPVFVGLAAAS